MSQTTYERDPQTQVRYERYLKSIKDIPCVFCHTQSIQNQFVSETNYFYILENKFPYQKTDFHYLIVPKRHIHSLDEFTLEEFEEWTYIQSQYILDWQDFDITTRGTTNIDKSVNHLHTHLIKFHRMAKQ